jgi:hypothetical protein
MNNALRTTSLAILMATSLAVATFSPSPWAAPGAHGPDGQHLDTPASAATASSQPRLETQTDLFELVARLGGGELSMLIDRYATNEPVLGAEVEVESGGLKAKAKFHADHGDYAIDDPALLKRLSTPGEHALVITVRAGSDSDLLSGTLTVTSATAAAAAGEHGHGHGHGNGHDHDDHHHGLERAAWIGAAIAALGLLGGVAWWRQRRRAVGTIERTLP